MANTPNKNYNNQNTGSNVNTWGVVNNSNFSIVDLNLGGRLNLTLSNSNVNVTANQAQNLMHILSGTLSGNINYVFPANGGMYLVQNATTGAFNITILCSGGSSGAILPQGLSAIVFINPDDHTVKLQFIGGILYTAIGVTTGSTDQQAATVSPAPYNQADGSVVGWVAGYSNTTLMTINFNSAGDTNVLKNSPSGLTNTVAGDVVAGNFYLTRYLAASSAHILINPTLSLGSLAPLGFNSTNFRNNAGNLDFSTTPVMPAGTTATTQSANDNSTKLATTAYIDASGRNSQGAKTISASAPSGGGNGDVWYQI